MSPPAFQPVSLEDPDLPSNDQIVQAVNQFRDERSSRPMSMQTMQPEDGGNWHGFAYPSTETPVAWIKLSESPGEARMQAFAYDWLMQQTEHRRQNVRIPKVYRWIEDDEAEDSHYTYIVMEYVAGKTFQQLLEEPIDETHEKELENNVAHAISLLLSIEMPADTPPAPLGGGLFWHLIFRDHEAPVEYETLADLEGHLNRVMRLKDGRHPISFSGERIVFCYSDIQYHNVMFTGTNHNTLYLIDFGHAAFLPISFMIFSLLKLCNKIAHSIMGRVGIKEEEKDQEKLEHMDYAQYRLFRTSNMGGVILNNERLL